MTKEDTAKLLAVMQLSYPNYKPEDLPATINLWHEMLGQYSYESAMAGLSAYIAEKHEFAPNIGQIIDKVYNIEHPAEMDPSEAWAFVSRALRNSAYNSEAEFAKLPPAIQRSIGTARQLHDWAIMDSGTVESVIQSNFLRSYRAISEKQREYDKLPMDVKKRIAEIQGHPMLDGAEYLEVD